MPTMAIWVRRFTRAFVIYTVSLKRNAFFVRNIYLSVFIRVFIGLIYLLVTLLSFKRNFQVAYWPLAVVLSPHRRDTPRRRRRKAHSPYSSKLLLLDAVCDEMDFDQWMKSSLSFPHLQNNFSLVSSIPSVYLWTFDINRPYWALDLVLPIGLLVNRHLRRNWACRDNSVDLLLSGCLLWTWDFFVCFF